MLIVLAPKLECSPQVLATWEHWALAGLLERAMWWEDGAAPFLVDGAETGPSTLVDGLAGHGSSVRVFALLPVVDDAPIQDSFLEHVDGRYAEIERSLESRDLPIIGVVAPTSTSSAELPVSLVRHHWRHLVVIAPEDRRSPQSEDIDELVDAGPDRYAKHVAAQLASVGDLWLAVDGARSPVDHALDRASEEMDAGADDPPVTVVRSFTRLVDGGYLLDHVAARAMAPPGAWPLPKGQNFRVVRGWDDKRHALTADFIYQHRELWQNVPDEEDPPAPFRLREALQEAWRRIKQLVVSKPTKMARDAIWRIFDLVCTPLDKFLGRRVWRPWDKVPEAKPREPRPDPARPEEPEGVGASAWSDLVTLSLGLVDGDQLPAWVRWQDPNNPDVRAIVVDPGHIVPDPKAVMPERIAGLLGVERPKLTDPGAVDDLVATLDRLLSYLEASLEEELGRIEVPPAVDPGEGAADGHDDGDARSERIAGLRRRIDDLRLAIGDLERWQRSAETSLLWDIGRRLLELRQRAAEEYERYQAALNAHQEGPDVEEERQRRVDRVERQGRIIRRLATFVALVAWGYVLVSDDLSGYPAGTLILLALVLARGGGRVVTRWRRRRALRGLDDGRLSRAQLYDLTIAARDLSERIERRYAELLDWGEILGWLVHHPWAQRAATGLDIPDPLDPESLPASFDVGIGCTTASGIDDLVTLGRTDLFDPGWLREVYDDIAELVGRRGLLRQGIDRMEARPDDPTVKETARAELLVAVRAREHETARERQMTERIVSFLAGRRPDQLFPDVALLKEGAEPPTAAQLPPIAHWRMEKTQLSSLTATVRGAVVRLRTDGAGGSGIAIDESGLVITNRHVVGTERTLEARLDDGTLTIATVVKVSTTTDLALVALRDAPPSFVSLANGGSVRAGDAIFTVGFPLLLIGDPSTSAGFVTSLRRSVDLGEGRIDVFQHSAPATGGASGSGVLNLRCELVGVHVGGEPGTDFVKYAVPVEDVRALVDDYRAARESVAPGPPSRLVQPPGAVPPPAGAGEDGLVGDNHLKGFLDAVLGNATGRLSYSHWRRGSGVLIKLPAAATTEPVQVEPLVVSSPTPVFGTPWRLQAVRVEAAPLCPASALRWFPEVADEVRQSGPPPDHGDDRLA